MAENIEQDPTIVDEPIVDPSLNVERAPVDLKDDDLVKVIYKGQEVVKPWKEARSNIQMQEDYTRGKQAISAKAKELSELYSQLTAKEKALLEKETALDTILGRATPKSEVQLADDDVLTVGQLNQLLSKFKDEVSSNLQNNLTEVSAKSEEMRTYQRWEDLTTDTVDALVKENPILEDIPHLSSILKREAKDRNPNSEKEMLSAIREAGKQMVERLNSRFVALKKQEVTRKQDLVNKGPEPPGGTPQFSAKKSYVKGRKVDWKDLENDIVAAYDE